MSTDTTTDRETVDSETVTYTGEAVVEAAGRQCHVEVELEAGRRRWSVGGRMAEGPRWWRGEIAWPDQDQELRAGTRIAVTLVDGRSAPAVVESLIAPDRVAVRGIAPPPFPVP